MEQLLEFAGNHTSLVAAFFAVGTVLIWHIVTDPGGKNAVDPVGATDLINHEDAVLLDVRSMAEHKDASIINSINIPLASLTSNLKTLEKHKDKKIVVYCRSGARSASACKQLHAQGYEGAVNLRGGILAWESANLPVKRKK